MTLLSSCLESTGAPIVPHPGLTRRASRARLISNFENLDLDELSKEKAYEFLFAWAPLKLVGATGSPGNPVATW